MFNYNGYNCKGSVTMLQFNTFNFSLRQTIPSLMFTSNSKNMSRSR